MYEEDDMRVRSLMTACENLLDTCQMLRERESVQLVHGPPAAESFVAQQQLQSVQPDICIVLPGDKVPMPVSARAGARGAQNPSRQRSRKSSRYATGGSGGESGSSSESDHDKASDRG